MVCEHARGPAAGGRRVGACCPPGRVLSRFHSIRDGTLRCALGSPEQAEQGVTGCEPCVRLGKAPRTVCWTIHAVLNFGLTCDMAQPAFPGAEAAAPPRRTSLHSMRAMHPHLIGVEANAKAKRLVQAHGKHWVQWARRFGAVTKACAPLLSCTPRSSRRGAHVVRNRCARPWRYITISAPPAQRGTADSEGRAR